MLYIIKNGSYLILIFNIGRLLQTTTKGMPMYTKDLEIGYLK